MKTVLICHEGDVLSEEGLARWLASFTDLVGVIVIREEGRRKARLMHEIKRSGWWRLPDIFAFMVYNRLFLARTTDEFVATTMTRLRNDFPQVQGGVQRLVVASPNEPRAQEFLRSLTPDLVLARCKLLIRKRVFEIPTHGTFVMHPGICPEYRNSHGCFWALANDDLSRVGMTLLKIDAGVDTGPVYGYYTYDYDEVRESHSVIQERVIFENLSALRSKLSQIGRGEAATIDTSGRASGAWGQPWLSRYVRWKLRARRRRGTREGSGA